MQLVKDVVRFFFYLPCLFWQLYCWQNTIWKAHQTSKQRKKILDFIKYSQLRLFEILHSGSSIVSTWFLARNCGRESRYKHTKQVKNNSSLCRFIKNTIRFNVVTYTRNSVQKATTFFGMQLYAASRYISFDILLW